ncbi:FecCD family ABC transporter permease [Paenibacillaceae bacterium WGS1546]|uniref:FecCD family ABC transporter permease n=1 Tax=Cohnella sp. WGS1546 TaxID=3366810 RepID=UPI00372D4247
MLRRKRRRKPLLLLAALSAIAVVLGIACVSIGAVSLPFGEVLLALFGRGGESGDLIVVRLRLPRIAAAMLVGAALAVAGALLQGVVRNPLASPDLVGVTGGASVAVVGFMTAFAGYNVHWIPAVAIGGALAAACLNYALAWRRGVSPMRLVLIGIGISTAAGALTMYLLISGPAYLAAQVLNWMTGSVYGTNWPYVQALWPWVAVFLPLSLLFAKDLNVQALGEEAAIGLGSRLQFSRFSLILCSVALAGAAVGVAGTLSFIGLLAPHMARRLVGLSYAAIVPASALLGAILLLLADLAGRTLFSPLDVPAGVFTAGIGAPFFLYLLMKRRAAR